MKRLCFIEDMGIVIRPDDKDGRFYAIDGGGIRDSVMVENKDKYYIFYDGAPPGKKQNSYWNVCLAITKDFKTFEKQGIKIHCSALTSPNNNAQTHKDYCGAFSPWSIEGDGKRYFFYLGSDNASPEGVPAFMYSTMLAVSDSLESNIEKISSNPGHGCHVCFPIGKSGSWDDGTASPGEVLINPNFKEGDKDNKKYLMFYSGSNSDTDGMCGKSTLRSIGIAQTDDLSKCDRFDNLEGNFWDKLPNPIVPPSENIENSSIFFEEETGVYWLFTNHVTDGTGAYTDAIWVYWSKDLFSWNIDNKAVVIDTSVSTWAHGAIGMPAVTRTGNKLTLIYDGVEGFGKGHLDRKIGLAVIKLPLTVK